MVKVCESLKDHAERKMKKEKLCPDTVGCTGSFGNLRESLEPYRTFSFTEATRTGANLEDKRKFCWEKSLKIP